MRTPEKKEYTPKEVPIPGIIRNDALSAVPIHTDNLIRHLINSDMYL